MSDQNTILPDILTDKTKIFILSAGFYFISLTGSEYVSCLEYARILIYSLRKKCPYPEPFWSAFSRIRIEYGGTLRISSYSVQMRENTDQNNSKYRHFLLSDYFSDSKYPRVLNISEYWICQRSDYVEPWVCQGYIP